jgi:hypothetical protein
MSKQIAIGNRVRTVKGTEGIVTKILEGGYLLEDGKRVRTESIAMVIPPRPKVFRLGDRVEYIGSDFNLKKQYAGTLEIWELGNGCDSDKCACLKPDGRVTSWVSFEDLELNAIEVTPSMTGLEGDLWA